MPLRLLVVDDSWVMRAAIRRLIEVAALPVNTFLAAENGQAALSLLKRNEVDLILVDLNMPVMNGLEFIRCIKEDPDQKRVPFIAMSADSTSESIQEMMDLGAQAYMPKPFRAEMLRSEILKIVGNQQPEGELDVRN